MTVVERLQMKAVDVSDFDTDRHVYNDAIELIDRLQAALKLQNIWVRGALRCKEWVWDEDQRELAERSCEQAEELL